jgi:hypothetical protein
MDRPTSTTGAPLPGLDDASPSGWDAHAVWQQRVRDPYLAAEAARRTQRIVLEQGSAGWDPLETWRLRVQRSRKDPA